VRRIQRLGGGKVTVNVPDPSTKTLIALSTSSVSVSRELFTVNESGATK